MKYGTLIPYLFIGNDFQKKKKKEKLQYTAMHRAIS